MNQKPVVGQRLFALNVGNSARTAPQVLVPVTVVSVGRKYFTVKRDDLSWWECKFYVDSWREVSNYSANYALYATEQEWKDEKESIELWKAIRPTLDTYTPSIPLDAIRKIKAILDGLKSGL